METLIKDRKKKYNDTYYNKNKEKVLEKLKVKIYCKYCDKHINKSSYTRHCNSKMHSRNKSKNWDLDLPDECIEIQE